MALNMHKEELDSIINEYISEIKKILNKYNIELECEWEILD